MTEIEGAEECKTAGAEKQNGIEAEMATEAGPI